MSGRDEATLSGATRYVEQSTEQVRDEYERVAHLAEAFERAKWGSREGMRNAFFLGADVIPWSDIVDWIDVGCGEADFFELIEDRGHRFGHLVGIDLSPSMIARAGAKRLQSPVQLASQSLESMASSARAFDLVTAVGVMQQSGMRPGDFAAALARLVKPGKYLFLTTKNAAWREFTTGRLTPEAGHSWFSPGEIRTDLAAVGFEILRQEGFRPRENRVVVLESSHTFFVLARRRP
jgi:2-polyprenyl-3-methyl-5-hydroxy-6-metoxy-1,4-benzoquinol methylase